MLTREDKELLEKKGISEKQIEEQLACFEKGFPFLRLAGAASVENNGIMVADEAMQKMYLAAWDAYKDGDRKIVKFVPASGAASRMFKNMFEFLGADYDVPTTDFEKKFFDHIHNFAFYNDLNAACMDNTGKNIDAVSEYAQKYGVEYNISFSEQKPSTDTIAADMENKPFRDDKGKLLFRPGGHGALIENLNDLDADIVFIKNIDNVVPDRLKADTVTYKKLIAGVLVTLQKQAFDYLELLDSGHYSHEQLENIIRFVQQQLRCRKEDIKDMEDADLVIYLRKKLNRPMRVCGMVKNVGEPGGGPFLAYNPDGTVSLQILESSQIDMKDPEKKAMFEQGTHFNPVDLVCAVRDYKGNKFNLTAYVDKATGFISYKSKNGKDLKALELPGLWNGSMSDWSTVFVEVPLSTFNPVKTVNDLLREQHQ